MKRNAELGCGLIGIGRTWGVVPKPVPSEAQAIHFLEEAYKLGVRYFDTAPAYGLSEERLGKFLLQLSDSERNDVTVATKFGEHWDTDTQSAYTDHSYAKLVASLDQSVQRLGRIDLLQIHKTTPESFQSEDISRALEYAQQRNIPHLGASVSDPETARLALDDERLDSVQLPYNAASAQMQPIVSQSTAKGKTLLINRPFQMGGVIAEQASDDPHRDAYAFILRQHFEGVILTGTANPQHLAENIHAFQRALELTE